MIEHETALRLADAETAYPYLLCGPHAQAKQARADIKSKTGVASPPPVTYTSRAQGAACWSATLTSRDAGDLAASPAFFHLTPVPASSKISPQLFSPSGDALALPSSVFHARDEEGGHHHHQQGESSSPTRAPRAWAPERGAALRLVLRSAHADNRASLAASWAAQGLGLGAGVLGGHAEKFFSMSDAAAAAADADGTEAVDAQATQTNSASTSKFRASRMAAQTSADCAALLQPEVFAGSASSGDGAVYVSFSDTQDNGSTVPVKDDKKKKKALSADCAAVAVAFLASQPEVARVEVPDRMVTKSDFTKHAHLLRGSSANKGPANKKPVVTPKSPKRVADPRKAHLTPRTQKEAHMTAMRASSPEEPAPLRAPEFAAPSAKLALKDAVKGVGLKGLKKIDPVARSEEEDEAALRSEAKPTRKLNYNAAGAIQSGSLGSTPLWDAGVDGAGQFVQVTDTGFDDASCFLRSGTAQSFTQVARSVYSNPVTDASLRKVVQYVSVALDVDASTQYGHDYASGHGSHCAGSVLGSVASDDPDLALGDHKGMAPGAQLMAFDLGTTAEGDLGGFPSGDGSRSSTAVLLDVAFQQGARVSSHSWGGMTSDYTSEAKAFDAYVYENDDALVLIAAGNDGDAGGGMVTTPGTLKNGLSVGAAEAVSDTSPNPDTVAWFSSRGPTNDMRIKPDLVAPGNPLMSCSASGALAEPTCSVTEMSGTSMATPATAGTAALVRQYLVDGFHARHSPAAHAASDYDAVSPSAALLKAMLIGSAAPMTHGYSADGGLVTLGEFYGPPAADGGQGSAQGDLWQFPVVDPDAITYGDDQVGDVQCDDQDYVGYSFTCMCHATCASCGAWHADPSDCHTCIDGLDHKVVYVDGTGTCAATVEGDYIAEPFTLGAYGVDYTQGFGHVRTSNVLPLDSSFDLFLFERSLAAHSSETMTYTVTSAATQVDVTLVWTDPPAEEGCDKLGAGGCLIHDLDLKVTLNGGRVYANFGAGSSGTYGEQEDEYNNVEKVSISALTLAAGDELSVMVLSNGLAYADTQKYAVAVTGHLEASDGPGGSNGNCFDGTSVVSVQDAVTRAAMPTPVSRLKVHDKVLAVDANHKATWAAVSSLPHSYSAADFVDITMDAAKDSPGSSSKSMPGALGNRLSVTEHHTFPSCHDARKMVAASELKPGSCLRTLQGGTQVVKAATRRLASPSDVTYTVELEGSVDMLVVGGVVTHAKPNTAAHRSAQNSKAKKKGAEAVLNIQQAGKRMKTNMAALLSEKSN